MKSREIYIGNLNLQRIRNYRNIAEKYGNVDKSIINEIYSQGAEWGIAVAEYNRQHPKQFPLLPESCTHPEDMCIYYADNHVWCSMCHTYIGQPVIGNNAFIEYKNNWYTKGDTIRYGLFKYKITFIGDDGVAIISRGRKEKKIEGNVKFIIN